MSIDADFAAWFRLLQTPGVGRESVRRLLAACGSPEGVLAAPHDVHRRCAGAAAARALQQEPPDFAGRLAAAVAWLDGADRHVIMLGHPAWPPMLLRTADPPLLLYVQGALAPLSAPSLAIVGSRNATAQGVDNARAFSRMLGEQGWVIVSGLALGIDAAAHEGALDAGAPTVAVMGTGPDRIYPARHRALAQRIVETGGALVSEYAPGVPALPENFPPRNRIIAGLSQGTLVVEAALRSGSLITARMASESGREVFAIPGSIHAPQSRGCHALIRQGAKLVESADDILEELRPDVRPTAPAARTGGTASDGTARPALPADAPALETEAQSAAEPAADPLLDALGHDPVTLDALMSRTGWPASLLTARLLEHELDGRVARLPGGLYQRRHAG